MSGHESRGSASEYQADERAGVARLAWRYCLHARRRRPARTRALPDRRRARHRREPGARELRRHRGHRCHRNRRGRAMSGLTLLAPELRATGEAQRTVTRTGVVIGGAWRRPMPAFTQDGERLQAALLERRTAAPRPLLARIAGAIWRWC